MQYFFGYLRLQILPAYLIGMVINETLEYPVAFILYASEDEFSE